MNPRIPTVIVRPTGTTEGNPIVGWIFLAGCLFTAVFIMVIYIRRYKGSKLIGPLTERPVNPYKNDDIKEEKTFIDVARFVTGGLVPNEDSVTKKLKQILEIAGSLPRNGSVPDKARIVSVKMEGFDFGDKPHQFTPIDGAHKYSDYEYQMYGEDAIQVTYYVENYVSYVAGFCIYVIKDYGISYRREVVRELMKYPKYKCTRPLLVEVEKEIQRLSADIPTECWAVKHCRTLNRDVMTASSDGSVYHKEWLPNGQTMKSHKCEGCLKYAAEHDRPPAYYSLSINERAYV